MSRAACAARLSSFWEPIRSLTVLPSRLLWGYEALDALQLRRGPGRGRVVLLDDHRSLQGEVTRLHGGPRADELHIISRCQVTDRLGMRAVLSAWVHLHLC